MCRFTAFYNSLPQSLYLSTTNTNATAKKHQAFLKKQCWEECMMNPRMMEETTLNTSMMTIKMFITN